MKANFLFILALALARLSAIAQDNVGIGVATPNPNAIVEMFANDKGLLIPRLTDTERLAIPAGVAEAGLLVYGASDNLFYYWDGTQWIPFPSATGTGADDDWSRDSTNSVLFPFYLSDRISIGANTANSSAILDVQSTSMGMLIPRMTTAQRLAISAPATGLKVFDTTAGAEMFYNGIRWLETGADPIGTINAFHKSLTGTPALPWGWAECNGQTLIDSESPYNGTALPNLNASFTTEAGVASAAGRFLRGDATSGTEVSDKTNTIGQFRRNGANSNNDGPVPVPLDGSFNPQPVGFRGGNDGNGRLELANRGVETHPGYMTVVWIIRVK